MVTQLALIDDVEDALGRDLTPEEMRRVDAILDKASEEFRRRAGQQFTGGTSTVRRKVNGGWVYLQQYPVESVSEVVDLDGNSVDFKVDGQWVHVDLPSDRFVRVTYDHGTNDPPDLVRLAVAEIAKRTLTVSEEAATGVSQFSETTGPFTESRTYSGWAQGGQTLLSPADMALADSYRQQLGHVWVARA